MARHALALVALAVLIAGNAGAATITLPTTGRVVKTVDGDTFVVKADKADYTVRLIGVDAPEAHPNARLNADTSLTKEQREAHLIAQGYARAMTSGPFDKDFRDEFLRLQQEARVAGRGLWAEGAEVPWPKLSEATLVGNRKSKKYHLPTCASVERMSPENRVVFESAEAAKAAGYVPCKVCKP